jgi:hypothetical protein
MTTATVEKLAERGRLEKRRDALVLRKQELGEIVE